MTQETFYYRIPIRDKLMDTTDGYLYSWTIAAQKRFFDVVCEHGFDASNVFFNTTRGVLAVYSRSRRQSLVLELGLLEEKLGYERKHYIR